MAKFIKINTLYRGFIEERILNVDDISNIHIGANMISIRTPFLDGSNNLSVTEETIKKLEKVLEVVEVDDGND